MPMNIEQAAALKTLYGTPLFILDEQALISRYNEFVTAMRSLYSDTTMAYSYKTNPLAAVITILHQQGALAEVVSHDEYQLAQRLAPKDSKIIFNGPLKLEQDLIQAMDQNILLHCDHFEEIERLAQVAKSHNKLVKMGIRLCIDEQGNWNRFGFKINRQSLAEAQCVVDYIKKASHLQLSSIHAHIGTNISNMNQFRLMSELLASFADSLKNQAIILESVDIGGGLAGSSPRWDEPFNTCGLADIKTYAQSIIPPLLPYLKETQAQLYFEPGRALVEHAVKLLFSVHAIRHSTHSSAECIVDSGIHTVPTSRVYRHPVTCFKPSSDLKKTTLLGPTCMQHDMSHGQYNLPALNRHDLLLMHNVGAYNLSRTVPFIHLRPGCVIYRRQSHSFELIKAPESLDTHLAEQVGF